MATHRGTVKMYSAEKGFGFIKQADGAGKDVFFHVSEIERSGVTGPINVGDALAFNLQETDKGLRAINIARA